MGSLFQLLRWFKHQFLHKQRAGCIQYNVTRINGEFDLIYSEILRKCVKFRTWKLRLSIIPSYYTGFIYCELGHTFLSLVHLSRRLTRWAYSIPMVRRPSVVVRRRSHFQTWISLKNPGRFAHFPVRPLVVSPTFPFAPSRFASGSFRPLSRSPLSRFAHFPVHPWVISPPYKILFLVLLFRPQKWYKALIFLLIDDFSLWRIIRDGKKKKKKNTQHFIRYFEK